MWIFAFFPSCLHRGFKSFIFICWMLCITGQKVSTTSLMAILSDCFPSSSCLLDANIGNNSNIRIKQTKKWLSFKTWCSLSVPRWTAHPKGNWNSWCLYSIMLAMYATTGLVCAPLNHIQWIKELRLCAQFVSKTVNVATLLFQRGRFWLVDKCVQHVHFSSHEPSNAKFVALSLQFPSSMLLGILLVRRIYTTIVLGTALLIFGSRANSIGHGPLYLHGKICSCFFNVDFWNGTPEKRTALLNLWVPALIWQRFSFDFRRAFAGCSMADSQVQKAIASLVALKKRKRVSQFRDETKSSLAPLLHALKRRQYALLQAILGVLNRTGCIYLSKMLPLFFCCAIPTFSTFFLFPFCTLVSVFSFC